MASSVTIGIDTTGPAISSVAVDGGALYTTNVNRDVSVAVASPDADARDIMIWGSVDPAANPSIQATEATSAWITLASPHTVRVSAGDGQKTINVRLRDDVKNAGPSASDTIQLDTTLPTVSIVAQPDRAKISQVAGSDLSSFSWSSDSAYTAFEARVVPTAGSPRTSGTVVPSAGGSTNVSGGAGPAATTKTTTIHGADLKAAGGADGDKIVKIFVQDDSGQWSP